MELSVQNIIRELQNNPFVFEKLCLSVYEYQYQNNAVYREYVDALGRSNPQCLSEIPYLPIQFFKSHQVITGQVINFEKIYSSSASTGAVPSKHFVRQYADYQASFETAFYQQFPELVGAPVLALLPSYLEREGSSLIDMAAQLIENASDEISGFFLYNQDELLQVMRKLNNAKQTHVLIGVAFALTDLAEYSQELFPYTIVMETGGMKGRKKEMIREELHQIIQDGLSPKLIVSEYGMTELLSQAYCLDGTNFISPPWMKVFIRDVYDPFVQFPDGKTGAINIIDLANLHSCSFIATQDLGKKSDVGFEVLGRTDTSDVRGCNLMVGF